MIAEREGGMVKARTIDEMLSDFDERRPLYEDFSEKMHDLLTTLLKQSGIKVHSITPRTKERQSFEDKIRRPDKNYGKLEDITDISGVRVICVDKTRIEDVKKIVFDNFEVDSDLSVDKSEEMDPDRFGYLSIHFIAKLPERRTKLAEYSRFEGLLFEIQVRTLLQHAWSDIQYGIGYKSKILIPGPIQRRLFRLAGLLELADDEFERIILDQSEYRKNIPIMVVASPQELSLDLDSFTSYMNTSDIVTQIINRISAMGFTVRPRTDESSPNFGYYLRLLRYFDITDISKLDAAFKKNADAIVKFAQKWMVREHKYDTSVSAFYLGYVLAASSEDLEKVKDYIRFSGTFFRDEADLNSRAENVIEAARRID